MRAAHAWRRWWPALLAAVVLYGLWALTLASSDEPERSRARNGVATAAPPAPAAIVATATQAEAARPPIAPAAAVDLPPGVSPEQWAAIAAELAGRPDAAAELQRLHDYLAWSDALRRMREAPASSADQLALAREVEQGLAERIRRAEVSSGEARQIESALLARLVPDEAARAERLRQWAAAELAPPAPADPRQESFARRQAEVVAAWSARPPAARDPAALERELETLRQQAFATPGGSR